MVDLYPTKGKKQEFLHEMTGLHNRHGYFVMLAVIKCLASTKEQMTVTKGRVTALLKALDKMYELRATLAVVHELWVTKIQSVPNDPIVTHMQRFLDNMRAIDIAELAEMELAKDNNKTTVTTQGGSIRYVKAPANKFSMSMHGWNPMM